MVTKPSQRARRQGKRKLRIYVDSNGNQRRTLTTYYKFHKRFPDFYYFHGAYVQKEVAPQQEVEQQLTNERFGEKEYIYHVKLIYAREKGHDNLVVELIVHWFGNRVPTDDEISILAMNYYDENNETYVSSNFFNKVVVGFDGINERSGYSYVESIEYSHNL